MKQLKLLFTVLFLLVLGLGNVWGADPVVLFHETFGDNTGSARNWSDSYSVKSGVNDVYNGITGYTVSNAKQGKNTTGSTASGLNQSTAGTDAYIIIGPLKVDNYTDLSLTYQWKAASTKGFYSTALYYATSSTGSYTEVTGSGNGATTFVERSYTLPEAAQVSTLYLKIVWNTSNTQAIIDEVDLQGIKDDNGGGGDPDPVASFTVSPTSIDFGSKEQGATVDAQDVTVTLTNTDYAIATLSGTNADAFEIVAGEELTETGVVSVRPTTATLAVAGTYTASLDIEADGVTGTKSVALTLTVTAPVVPTGTFSKYVGATLVEGEYVICSGTTAMKNVAVSGPRIGYETITVDGNSIVNPSADVIWKLEKDGDYFTLYNEKEEVYAAFNSTDGRGTVIESVTDYARWQASKTADVDAKYELTNKGKTGKNLRLNGTYGFASYATTTGTSLTLYAKLGSYAITKAACTNGSVDVTGVADLSQVTAGATVTLSNTPADGYKLAEYDVYKTGDAATKVTVTDGKFTMPAYDVTVSATFELAKVFDGSELTLSGEYPTEFWKGDAFSHDGMTVTAHFNTGDETVTGVFSGYDMATAGVQTVAVTFTEGGASQTATYDIEVKTIANTQETAYTATEAIAKYVAGKDLSTPVYVKGIVSEMISQSLPADGYLNFYVSEDGLTTSQQFEFYKTYKATGKVVWTSYDDVQVGDEVVGYGKLGYYSRDDVYEFDGNTESYVVSLNRPVVLESITLNADNVKKTYKIGVDDVFSAENLVVTAHYNVSSNDKTIDLANVTFSGYNMAVSNTYEVTVSYTENEVTKTATYEIQVKPNCDNLATITMGATEHGTFDLSVKGEQCAEGDGVSTVLTADPATHYHLASVTATNGTVGAIEGNTCTISDITADAEITAVFEEDAKGTATFVAGAAEATGTAPAAITKYVGQTLTVPANTFAWTGHTFAGWKYNETIYQKGDELTVAGDAEFVAQWEALPVWASTYTSNVTLSTTGGTSAYAEKVKVNGEATEYDAIKAGASKTAGKCVVTVPAGASALHFHAILWNATSGTLSIKNGDNELFGQTIKANVGFQSNSPYTLVGDPTQDYYNISFAEPLAEATNLTFAASVNRFAIYGVNYVAPASVTLAPASHDFEEVKEGETAEFEFTATKNIFATGDVVVTFEGADAAAFSAGTVDAEGKFTVTFAPTEVRAYSATVKVSVDGAEATATLTGEGISATTPAISVDAETVEFGKVKQDASVAAKTVNVTLEYLAEATIAISGTVFSIDKTNLTENGAITISANTAAMGTYSETLTISGEGATSKTVTVTMEVTSKYASEYTSNVTVGNDKVIIDEVEYEAIKKGTSSASQSTTITVPKGTQTLHFHAVAWNDENTVLVVKQGDNTLGSFNLYKDDGVRSSSPFTLKGNNYDSDQYFSVDVAAYTAEGEAVITFTTTASPYRFVLYGVNQEGGIVPVLDHIAIEGEATELEYEAGAEFNPAGLSVKAYYTMEGVLDESKTKTLAAADFEWSFSPATLAAETESVEVTATYEGLTATKTIEGLTVTVPVPTITVNKKNFTFGEVVKDATVDAQTVNVTLKNLTSATLVLAGEGAAAFGIDQTELTESATVTITPSTAEVGEFAATVTISAEGVEDVVLNLSLIVTAPAEAVTYYQVTDIRTLAPGDVIVLGCANKSAVAGAQNGDYLNKIGDATFENGVLVVAGALEFVLGKDGDNWTLTSKEGKLGTTAEKKMTTDETKNNYQGAWTIRISAEGVATITSSGRGKIQYNSGSPRFLNYTSNQDSIEIYRAPMKVDQDSEDASVWTERDGQTINATVDRSFNNNGNWNTLCLPFAMNAEQIAATFGACEIRELADAYWKVQDVEMFVRFDQVYTIEAGKPYLIRLNDEKASLDFAGVTVDANASTTVTKAGFISMIGTFVKSTIPANDYYLQNSDNYLYCWGAPLAIKAFRCYFHFDTESGQAPARARVVMNSEVVTDLDNLNTDAAPVKFVLNGQVYILRGGKTYNAQGQLVK